MLFTGDLVHGQEAMKRGLVLDSVPLAELDARMEQLAARIVGVPRSSPEGVWFKDEAEREGFKAAITIRDRGDAIAEGWSRPFRSTFGPYRP